MSFSEESGADCSGAQGKVVSRSKCAAGLKVCTSIYEPQPQSNFGHSVQNVFEMIRAKGLKHII